VATTIGTVPDTHPGTPGDAGIGDRLYPKLGNGGYDVAEYAIDLRLDPQSGIVEAITTVEAVATEDLLSLNLDLAALEVVEVMVDGVSAGFAHEDGELTVSPQVTLTEGSSFVVEVSYRGAPGVNLLSAAPFFAGWRRAGDTFYVVGQPDGASTWFPVNDHPLDRATVDLTVRVPAGIEVVTVADISELESESDGTVSHHFQSLEPVAPYLISLAIGQFESEVRVLDSRIKLSLVAPPGTDQDVLALFDVHPEMLDFFAERFGPYPFDGYGALLIDDENLHAALETQELTTFGMPVLVLGEPVLSHELSHQWFGDAVAVSQWDDIWLNEGFATFAQWLWLEHTEGRDAFDREVSQAYDLFSGKTIMEQEHLSSLEAQRQARLAFPPPNHPQARSLFNASVYLRGGLTLVALRDLIGEESLLQILRNYVERYKGDNVLTEDFLAAVGRSAGSEAADLARRWVNDPLPPAMPARDLVPLG
jgi:aminopeptidase N